MDTAGTEKINSISSAAASATEPAAAAVIALPPVRDFYFTPSRASALGAEALRSLLEDTGISTEIFNFPAEVKKPHRLPLPAELAHLGPYIVSKERGPLSFFTGYRQFGPSASECADRLLRSKPDIVLISCFAWAYAAEAVELAAAVKKLAAHIPVAAGGAGVTVNPDYFTASGAFDHVLPGEAEKIIPGFLGHISSRTAPAESPGFVWSETGVSDSKNMRFVSAILTRGCPKSCRFCANHLVHGRRFRKAPLDSVAAGIAQIPADRNVSINFEDDNLGFDFDYFTDVIDIVKKRFPDAGFTAENGLDYTFLTAESVRELIRSGFRSFNFSMASASSRLLSNENRPADISHLETIVTAAADAGASSTTYFICGLEEDTVESTLNNLLKLHRLPTLTGISMFYPVPGLPGFPSAKLNQYPPRLCAGSSAVPWNKSLSTKQLITAFRISRLSNLLKTENGLIKTPAGREAAHETERKLIPIIKNTGKLHTFSGKTVIEAPHQDDKLVKGFLESI